MASGYSISLIRDLARGTSQLYLRVAWTSAFKKLITLLIVELFSLKLMDHCIYFSGTKSRLAVIISVLYVTEFNFRFIILS